MAWNLLPPEEATEMPSVIPTTEPSMQPSGEDIYESMLNATVAISNETLVASAFLIVEMDPLISDLIDALDSDPDDALLLEQLRNRSANAWASPEGLLVATGLDNGDLNDEPAYLELRGTCLVFMIQLCQHIMANPGTFLSEATKSCVCAEDIPPLHCAAKADREFVEFLEAVDSVRQLWDSGRAAEDNRDLQGCELDLDFFKIFQAATIGKPNCIGVSCSFPFPPPMSWMGFEFGAKGCIPGLDLTAFEVCDNVLDETDCKSIDDITAEFEETTRINFITDQQFVIEGGICLQDVGGILKPLLIILDFFEWSHCLANIELGFHYMMGYLGLEVNVGIFEILKLSLTVDAQFYDDVKDRYGVCLLLTNEDCSGQGGKDKGQNSCSLRAGQNRGSFSIAATFPFYKKEHEIARWGPNEDGVCLAQCESSPENSPPPERWTKTGYRGGGNLPGSSDITGNGNCIITASEIQQAPFNVVPNDGIDDSVGLQAAIDHIGEQCSGSFSQRSIIELPSGTIDISTEIHLDVDFLVLRGRRNDPDEDSSTKVEFRPGNDTVYDGISDFDLNEMFADKNAKGGWIWPGRGAFRVQTREVHKDYTSAYRSAAANRMDFYEGSVNFHWKSGIEIARTACKGSTEISLTEPDTGISVGDFVWVGGSNSQNMYDHQGVLREDRICMHMRQQIFVVTNIEKGGRDLDVDSLEISLSGDTITIDKPLEFDLYTTSIADISPEMPCEGSSTKSKVVKLKAVRGVGLENFFLTQIVDGHSASEADFNYNNIVHEQAMHGIVFKWAVDSYVQNVRTYMTGSHPIVTEMAKNLQFEDNVLEGSWNKGKGGNGYFRNSKIWDSLIRGNTATGIRHLTLQWSASGNVVADNTLDCDLNLHGGWERNNLIERNTVNIPYDHRDCSPNCNAGDETWYPIWWGAGEHAGGWSGATGPRNIFFNNVLTKQTVPAGAFETYAPYGSNPNKVFQFGWDRDVAAGSSWEHLSINGQKIDTWTDKETIDYTSGPGTGVNSNCIHSGSTLVDVDYTAFCSQ